MKRLLIEVIAGALFCGLCVAQDTTTPPNSMPTSPAQQAEPAAQSPQTQTAESQSAQPQEHSLRVAPGSVIPVQLTETVDAKKAKVGDEVDAKVTQDMKSANGELVLAKDTKVVGQVIEAQARSREDKESEVGIAFDHAVMKDGTVASLPMSIQAVIALPSQNQNSAGENAGGGGQGSSAPSGEMPPGNSGRAGGMNPAARQAPAPGSFPDTQTTDNTPSDSNQRPAVTANTQGVVGISSYKLSTAGEGAKGSVVSSEKGNVKLERGTILLLRVNQ